MHEALYSNSSLEYIVLPPPKKKKKKLRKKKKKKKEREKNQEVLKFGNRVLVTTRVWETKRFCQKEREREREREKGQMDIEVNVTTIIWSYSYIIERYNNFTSTSSLILWGKDLG